MSLNQTPDVRTKDEKSPEHGGGAEADPVSDLLKELSKLSQTERIRLQQLEVESGRNVSPTQNAAQAAAPTSAQRPLVRKLRNFSGMKISGCPGDLYHMKMATRR